MDTLNIFIGYLGAITGFVGLIAALIAIYLHFKTRDEDREIHIKTIVANFETFRNTASDFLRSSLNIIKELQDIRDASQQLRPGLSIFLASQWRFIEKIFKYRFEKHSISRKIASKYIKNNMQVLLDSGSTIDLVTSELLVSPVSGIHVHSNNVFAAMHLVGTKEVPFRLFPGRFSERFAAVYSREAFNRIETLGFNLYILAATALRFETGIMVHIGDDDNYNFKRTTLMAFKDSPESTLLIAVDQSKFFEPVDNHMGVTSPEEWMDIISKAYDRIIIVTSPPAPDFEANQLALVAQQISKFRGAVIKVDDDPIK